MPSDEDVAAVREALAASAFRHADRDETGFGERYVLDGVECQVGHVTLAGWERELSPALDGHEFDPRLLKVLSGLFEGRSLHGADVVERLRLRGALTDARQRALIAHYWRFFPLWYFAERLAARDTLLWRYDILVESSYNLIGSLAALNGLWFSRLELKRMRRLLERFAVAPPELAGRIEGLFSADVRGAAHQLERLVEETAALIAVRFPDLDLALSWGGKPTPPGSRERPSQRRDSSSER